MFFSGGTFGHESEVREASKRQTGRRHQPRDMAEGQTDATGTGAAAAARGVPDRHVSEQKQMSSGPSFMDRMYAHDASGAEPAHAARRHKAGPKDNLNIFAWQTTDPASKAPPPKAAARGPRVARDVDAKAAVPTAEDRRAQESRKFETHSESTFLKFSDTPVDGQSATQAGGRRASNTARRESGLMGELMREQQERPHGKRVTKAEEARRRGGGGGAEEQGVAGFPGMGKRSAPRAVPHLHRKVEDAGVFPPAMPPWAQHDDIVEPERRRNGGKQPAPPAAAAPPYHIDDSDYEDRRLETEDGVGAYHDHQRRMQEIEMYDDGDDEGYEVAPQRGGGGGGGQPHLQWLDEANLGH